jgi:hypothetical protein
MAIGLRQQIWQTLGLGIFSAVTVTHCGDSDESPTSGSGNGTGGPMNPGEETGGAPSTGIGGSGASGSGTGGGSQSAGRWEADACALLDPEWLAENVSFEFGESVWEVRPGDVGECTWHNPSKFLNLKVSLWSPEVYSLEERLSGDHARVEAEALSSPAGAVLWRDASNGSAWQVWLPLGSAVGHLVQDLLMISEEQLVAIAEEVTSRASTIE